MKLFLALIELCHTELTVHRSLFVAMNCPDFKVPMLGVLYWLCKYVKGLGHLYICVHHLEYLGQLIKKKKRENLVAFNSGQLMCLC